MLEYFPLNISTLGAEHDKVFAVVYYITVGIFWLVNAVFLYFIYKFRYRKGRKAHYYHGNNMLEFTWTLLPTILFAGIGLYSEDLWAQMRKANRSPKPDIEIAALGQQFRWVFKYPGADGVLGKRDKKFMTKDNIFGTDPNDPYGRDDFEMPSTFHVPVNKNVVVRLTAVDVLHSFFLPHTRIKQDAVPGMWIDVWFDANRTGEYELACAELCGMAHTNMRGVMIVQSQTDYDNWMTEKIKANAPLVEAMPVAAPAPEAKPEGSVHKQH